MKKLSEYYNKIQENKEMQKEIMDNIKLNEKLLEKLQNLNLKKLKEYIW